MLRPVSSTRFEKDLRRVLRRWADAGTLRTVMRLLIAESPLEPRHRNHKLSGSWHGRYECHVAPDWLLIYKLDGATIVFERTGTHSDLFE